MSICEPEVPGGFKEQPAWRDVCIVRPRDLVECVFVCASIHQRAYVVHTSTCGTYRRVCQGGARRRIPWLDINLPVCHSKTQ